MLKGLAATTAKTARVVANEKTKKDRSRPTPNAAPSTSTIARRWRVLVYAMRSVCRPEFEPRSPGAIDRSPFLALQNHDLVFSVDLGRLQLANRAMTGSPTGRRDPRHPESPIQSG